MSESKIPSVATGNKRLLKLAEFLEQLPRKRFDYDRWVGDDWKGVPDLSCGTTACALGWAAAMPEFRRLGLRLIRPDYGDGEFGQGYVENLRTGHHSETAAMEIFGLTYDDAEYLFTPAASHYGHEEWEKSPASNASPKTVAKHIRWFDIRWFVERRAA